ncbi:MULTISPECIES: hypothetical protein [unclassified Tolypothrix]|jgi:hypothetical protein|uniref:hypothetical protein n=1 Tax=unclassified Tolypothrix TaxID=2649714 RepID=UPI0005EAA658|nr:MULTISPECIES: hypothetical protein [unclassified Tolypothrix]BAY95907.1 hypothetical protein NIES3275_79840 [Microchaete diplosiphon NIES-3275]EKE96558.1 hypothetical protein FDUTEX481_06567 [Tolypothrix sp. PCC 7601]MBE9084709.1 hypothetical protein [Tolypothrix sp. LEGE 11397]UYD30934.1 hypothetical protein HGR01_39440 [Tolypothrix sp. PCC 7712]UYD38826.1 hypothetical protein HG267_40595 [Tolypothrix sp. PCC 7601]
MSKPSPFKKLFETKEESQIEPEQPTEATTESNVTQTPTLPPPAPTQKEPRKRGRPATGKRSDDAWIGRTYYVKRSTDLDVEEELLKLKRRGVEIDKSELVDFLMAVWVKWQQGENIDLLIDEFTPRRNSKLD